MNSIADISLHDSASDARSLLATSSKRLDCAGSGTDSGCGLAGPRGSIYFVGGDQLFVSFCDDRCKTLVVDGFRTRLDRPMGNDAERE